MFLIFFSLLSVFHVMFVAAIRLEMISQNFIYSQFVDIKQNFAVGKKRQKLLKKMFIYSS